MLYDKQMKEQAILIKQRNGKCYSIFPTSIMGSEACVISRHEQALALSDRRGIFLSNDPVDIAMCENVTIRNGSVTVLGLSFIKNVKQRKHEPIGCYSVNLDNIDSSINCTAGEFVIDDVESINADSRYFIALLNAGIISIDNEAMKAYDLTPRWILYGNIGENPKKYIK